MGKVYLFDVATVFLQGVVPSPCVGTAFRTLVL